MFSGWKLVFGSALLLALAVVVTKVDPGNIEFLRMVQKHAGLWIGVILNVAGILTAGAAVVASEEKKPLMILAAIAVGGLHLVMLAGALPHIR